MSPFMEVIEEKIALMAIVFFFTILGLMTAGEENASLVTVSLGVFLFIASLVIEVAILAWIFFSVRKWMRKKKAWKTKRKVSTGGF